MFKHTRFTHLLAFQLMIIASAKPRTSGEKPYVSGFFQAFEISPNSHSKSLGFQVFWFLPFLHPSLVSYAPRSTDYANVQMYPFFEFFPKVLRSLGSPTQNPDHLCPTRVHQSEHSRKYGTQQPTVQFLPNRTNRTGDYRYCTDFTRDYPASVAMLLKGL